MATGYVYFVHAPAAGLIKIGFTRDYPCRRFVGLQAGSPAREEMGSER